MATHYSVLAWRILWTEEPGGLQSMESQRIRQDWTTNTFAFSFQATQTSLVAQTVNRLSMMRETRVRSLGWEDPLEKEMAIHSSTIAWKTPWTEEPSRLQSMGLQRVGNDWATSRSSTLHTLCSLFYYISSTSDHQALDLRGRGPQP